LADDRPTDSGGGGTSTQTERKKIRPLHPKPTNKKAIEHLQRLRRLGYNNFNEVDVDYWEPKLEGEASNLQNARRQKECKEMDTFITKLEARQKNEMSEDLKPEARARALAEANQQLMAREAEMRDLEDAYHKQKEIGKKATAELALEREARLKAEEELEQYTQCKEKRTKLAEELTNERDQRLKLEEKVQQLKSNGADRDIAEYITMANEERSKKEAAELELQNERKAMTEIKKEMHVLKEEIAKLKAIHTEETQRLELKISEVRKRIESSKPK
jgi:hypothetical protein